jgi:2-keto-3-deoxy-L-rhamnonate aldolase RhmA
MNTPAIQQLKRTLSADRPAYGLWVTLDATGVSEIAVALGVDWIVVDAEHGHLDWQTIVDHIRAAVRSETVVLVRIAELNGGLIKRVLDIGADGVVVPWIESADQLRQAVAYAHYPPKGVRGIGAERATGWGACFAEHVREAGDNVLVVPLIETVTGRWNINELVRVEGVEIFFIGPADYSASAGHAGQWEGPRVAEQLLTIKDTVRNAGKHCGVVATGNDNLLERREQGFRMLGLGLDTGLLIRGLTDALTLVGRTVAITPTLVPKRTNSQ